MSQVARRSSASGTSRQPEQKGQGTMIKATMALLALLLVIPASASAASTAKFSPRDYFNGREEEPDEFDPSIIEVTGDGGVNTIALSLSGKTVTISDASGITAGARCKQLSATSA